MTLKQIKLEQYELIGWLRHLVPNQTIDAVTEGRTALRINVWAQDGLPTQDITLIQQITQGKKVWSATLPMVNVRGIDAQMIEFLKAAFHVCYARHCQIENGWITMGQYGTALRMIYPEFNVVDFGVSTLHAVLSKADDILEIHADSSPGTHTEFHVRSKEARSENEKLRDRIFRSQERMTGVIIKLMPTFGFLTPESGGDNLFFHATEVRSGFEDLRVGMLVAYTEQDEPDGKQRAVKVKVCESKMEPPLKKLDATQACLESAILENISRLSNRHS